MWHGPLVSCHQGLFGPRASSRLRLFMDAFILRERGCPSFPIFFWGGGGGGTLLPPPEGLIYCYRRREITAIIATDSSLA
jgi:hypothetical protein